VTREHPIAQHVAAYLSRPGHGEFIEEFDCLRQLVIGDLTFEKLDRFIERQIAV